MFATRQLKAGRQRKGWTQQQAAAKLGVSQPYLVLLEKGLRKLTPSLARKFRKAYDLTPEVLPVTTSFVKPKLFENSDLTGELAALGYPGFSYVSRRQQRNPAEVLFGALALPDLDSRLAEALPWIVSHYPEMDWDWLMKAVKIHELQNRLGFVVSVARQFAEERGDDRKASLLSQHEAALDRARLVREDTLSHESMTEREKQWLRENRPEQARKWNLLTDLTSHSLMYAS
jgi:transcriptional regulator with XRE-family HTH domain